MILKLLHTLGRPLMQWHATRAFATSAAHCVRKVEIKETDNEIIIEGKDYKSPREGKLIPHPKRPDVPHDACPLCRLNIKRLNYTDVLILSQFMDKEGKVLPRVTTKLCGRQYRIVKKSIEEAQRCKLLPRPADYEVYGPWDEHNTYHDWPPRYRDQPLKLHTRPDYWNMDKKPDDQRWQIDPRVNCYT